MLFELCFREIAFKTGMHSTQDNFKRNSWKLRTFWPHCVLIMRTIIVRNRRYAVVHYLLLIQTFTMIVVSSSLRKDCGTSKKYLLVLILYTNCKAKRWGNFHWKEKRNFSRIAVMIITAGKTYGYNIQFVCAVLYHIFTSANYRSTIAFPMWLLSSQSV